MAEVFRIKNSRLLLLSLLTVFVVFMGFSFSSHNVYATNFVLNDSSSCINSPYSGSWASSNSTCFVFNPTINSADNAIVAPGVSLTISGIFTLNGNLFNNGTLVIYPTSSIEMGVGSTIGNNGDIENFGLIDLDNSFTNIANNPTGVINNHVGSTIDNVFGIITNNGGMFNNGNINNSGIIDNMNGGLIGNGNQITNNFGGTITNHLGGNITVNMNSTLTNDGNLNNDSGGDVVNLGIFINNSGAIISNFGSINNNPSGTFNNNLGSIINNNSGGIISNDGNFTNQGTINNYCGAIFTNTGSFIGNSPLNLCPIISITSPGNLTNVLPEFTITGTATSDSPINNVRVKIDSGSYSPANDVGVPPWSTWQFFTSGLSSGSHTITANATNNAGSFQTFPISVNVVSPVVQFDKLNYLLSDTAQIQVTSPVSNTNPGIIDIIVVMVNSTSANPIGIGVPLVETGTNTGVFVGSFDFTNGTTSGTTIHSAVGDTITAKYAGISNTAQIISTTTISFDQTSYALDDGGFVTVTDNAANTNSTLIDTIAVLVNSTSDVTGFTTTLVETGVNTGIFTNPNLITFTESPTNVPNLQLHVTTGDKITAQYLGVKATATAGTTPTGTGIPPSSTDPIRFDSDSFYTETRTAITVASPIRANAGTITITVSDTNTGNSFNVNLIETPPGSGIFTTPYLLTLSNLNPDDPTVTSPVLHVNVGDVVQATDITIPSNFARATIVSTPATLQLIGSPTDTTVATNCATDLGANDVDKDGICDIWETTSGLRATLSNGDTFTYASSNGQCAPLLDDPQTPYHTTDGTNPPACPIANTNHKDIYVEVDYMTDHKPSDDALWSVIQAFKAKNIFLHILVDEDIGFHQDSMPYFTPNPIPPSYNMHDFQSQKTIHFGTVSDRTCPATLPPGIPDCATYVTDLLTAKRQLFHYAMFIHDMTETPMSSGYGEIGGNDFVVSLGEFAGHVGSTTQQAATFMHELGHNLNLRHGGFEDYPNCKPNYPSIMNYAYQFPLSEGGFVPDTSWVMDYSRAKYSTIYQSSLSESTPALNTISGIPTRTTVVGGIVSGNPLTPQTVSTGVGVNWDQASGPTSYSQNVDYNRAISDCQTDTGTTASLVSNNDWTTMALNFRPFGSFATGLSTDPVAENEPTINTENEILSVTGAPAPVSDAASAAPTLNLITSSVTINPGDTFTRSGSFTDFDSSSWTATVDYGDGSGTQALALSSNTFTLNHVYSNSGTFNIDVTITNNRGGTAAGTITVNVSKTQLIVVTHVINNNGGGKTASAFTDTVIGSNPSPAIFAGVESSGVTVDLNAGAYSVSESMLPGYSQSFSADCSGTINQGDIKTCIITNDDQYNFVGLLSPISPDSGNIFKLKSTIPVKFTLTNDHGVSISSAIAKLYVAKVTNNVVGSFTEAVSTSVADRSNQFRYSGSGQYIFNLGTNGMTAGTWTLKVQLDDGSSRTTIISLK